MIIDNKPEYIVIKLRTGEEIFGKNVDITTSDARKCIKIHKPHYVTQINAEGALGLVPFVQLSDSEDFVFSNDNILTFGKMTDMLIEEYKKTISPTPSIIAPAAPKIIT